MARIELGNEYGSENIEIFGNTVDHPKFKPGPGNGGQVQDYKPIPLKIGQKYKDDPKRWTINLPGDDYPEQKANYQPAHGVNEPATLGNGPGFGTGPAPAPKHGQNQDPYAYDYGYKGPGPITNLPPNYYDNPGWVSTVESMFHLAGKSTVYEANALSLLVGTDENLYETQSGWSPSTTAYSEGKGSPWANAVSTVVQDNGAGIQVTYKGNAQTHLGLDKSNIGGLSSQKISAHLGSQAVRNQTVEVLFADGEKISEEKSEILSEWEISSISSIDVPAVISAAFAAIKELNDRVIYLEKMHCVDPASVPHCPSIPDIGPILARLDALEAAVNP